MSGMLYIVATPIGNLQDITFRALETLQQVDYIFAEDSRHAKILLNHYNIKVKLKSYHAHNESSTTKQIITLLNSGLNIALISDAGTPLISDPGYILVKEAIKAAIKVIPIPGCSAVITALSASGISVNKFCFEGFLPAKAQQKYKYLQSLITETRTLVFYESPHRIVETLKQLQELFVDRTISLARELTKKFETILQGKAVEILEQLNLNLKLQKGEFVIIISGAVIIDSILTDYAKNTLKILLVDLPVKQAVALAAKITHVKKNLLYNYALSLHK